MNEKYEYWRNFVADKKIKRELQKLSEKEIVTNFSSSLSFGTAVMRGVMALGSGCLNVLTVSKLAGAVGRYLQNKNARVAISFDTRFNSKDFSRLFAKILAEYGVEVLLFRDYSPTPVLVYAGIHYRCDISVIITASHNRKEYNGIKLYDKYGIQIDKSVQEKIIDLFNKTDEVEVYNRVYNKKLGKVKFIEKDFIDIYLQKCLKNSSVEKEEKNSKNTKKIANISENLANYDDKSEIFEKNVQRSKNEKRTLKITYSPLNGTGFRYVERLLGAFGFTFHRAQANPDPNFSTCPYPNPEFEEAFIEAKKVAKKYDSDIIIATDPDADRLGVMVKDGERYVKLSGNEVGYIFADYLLSGTNGKAVVTSVVTSPLIDKICKQNDAKLYKTLTGFMSMGSKAKELSKKYGRKNIVLIYEESCGYAVGNIYDKDGITASLLIVQIAEKLKKEGKTLIDYINIIYTRYGNMTALSSSIALFNSGCVVDKIRKTKLKSMKMAFDKMIDYQNDNTHLPKQNFLEFRFKDGSFIIRPSGTEPKLKIYLFHRDEKRAHELLNKLINHLKSIKI